jgi:hypothetical protein
MNKITRLIPALIVIAGFISPVTSPASAAPIEPVVTWASIPVPGTLSPALEVTGTLSSVPTDPSRRVGGIFVYIADTTTAPPKTFPVRTTCRDTACPFESISIVRAGSTTSLPLDTPNRWSFVGAYYVAQLKDYANSNSAGIYVGDKVTVKLRPGAFVIPSTGGSFKVAMRFDWYKVLGSGLGENFVQESSESAAFTVPAGKAPAPWVPGNVKASDGNATAAVSWDGIAGGGAPDTYQVESSPAGFTCTATFPATTCSPTGLVAGTEYQFRVRAVNSSGTSAWSEWSPVAIPATTAAFAPPIPTAVPGNTSVLVSWTPASTGGVARSYRVTVFQGATPTAFSCTAYHPATSCVVAGLTNDLPYKFGVQAVNGAGASLRSGFSDLVTPTGTLVTGPSVPAAPVKAESLSGINLTLSPPSTGATPFTYTVTTSPTGGTCVVKDLAVSCTGLKLNTAYRFRVTATNSFGPSTSVESDPMYATDPKSDVAPIESDGSVPPAGIPAGDGKTFTATNDSTFLLSWDKAKGKLGSKATGIYTGYIQAVATFTAAGKTHTCSAVFGTLKAMPMKTAAQKTASMRSKTFTGKQFCVDNIKMDARTLAPKGGMTAANFKKIKSMKKTSAELAKEKLALAALKNFTGEVSIQVTRYRAWPTTMVNIGDHNSKGGKIPFLIRNTKVNLG